MNRDEALQVTRTILEMALRAHVEILTDAPTNSPTTVPETELDRLIEETRTATVINLEGVTDPAEDPGEKVQHLVRMVSLAKTEEIPAPEVLEEGEAGRPVRVVRYLLDGALAGIRDSLARRVQEVADKDAAERLGMGMGLRSLIEAGDLAARAEADRRIVQVMEKISHLEDLMVRDQDKEDGTEDRISRLEERLKAQETQLLKLSVKSSTSPSSKPAPASRTRSPRQPVPRRPMRKSSRT